MNRTTGANENKGAGRILCNEIREGRGGVEAAGGKSSSFAVPTSIEK